MIFPTASDLVNEVFQPFASTDITVVNERALRVRLVDCRLERRPVAISRVVVEFDGPGASDRISCAREAQTCPAGDLRLAALATMDALCEATRGALQLDFIGAKPVRAFDTTMVVVAALAHHEGTVTKIVGAAIVDDDLLLATSRATLAALNRLASPLLARLLPYD